ncbi:unnamed protein product [Polarella glacialis]|uniref:Reverse transcriptase domain-containing protein n=1 Tax=Polarella glacialis TaxID=89957 RepID=A0A813D0J4_POLGL|nr:unnamed protein product [Polarella glacialis]
MFNIIESTQQWPFALTTAYVAAIPKDEHRLRLLGITPQVYRTWARARVQDLSDWVKAWIGDDLHGGCQGWSTITASLDIVLELSRAIIDDEDFCGTSLDYTACFDRVDANLCIQLLVKLGLPSTLGDTIKAFYANLQKTVKIGATISSPLASPAGILQGCPFSALLLSALMVTWVKFARTHVQPEEELNLSVYLDDRHVAAPNAITVAKVLEVSVEFDRLANGILNESKTQIYGTPSSTMTPITEVMPQAVRVDRVWTLGFSLPTGADNGNVDIGKMQARVDKATRVAEKAQHLPHDIRIRALESCFPAVLEYGVEFLPHTFDNLRKLKGAIAKAVWGGKRPGASPQVVWTLLYKGHRLLPLYRPIQEVIRLLYDMIQNADARHQATIADLVNKVRGLSRRSARTPFHVIQTECSAFRWRWTSWHVIHVLTAGAEFKRIDLLEPRWHRHAQVIREGVRFHIWRTGPATSPTPCLMIPGGGWFSGIIFLESFFGPQ